MKKLQLIFAILVLFSAGCKGNDPVNSENTIASTESNITVCQKEIVTVERDAGVVRQRVKYDFNFDMKGTKEIQKVVLSCGCTQIPMTAGDVIDLSKPFTIDVDLKGKPPGVSIQTFVLKFTDGDILFGKLKYHHIPLPSYTPNNLIFQGNENSKEITLVFFAEQDVVLKEVDLPSCISMSEKERFQNVEKSQIVLLFTLDRKTNVSEDQQGVIQISTSSETATEFRIPYLILSN